MIRLSIGRNKGYRALVVTKDSQVLAVDVIEHTFDTKTRNSNVLDDVLIGLQKAVAALQQHKAIPDVDEYFIVEFKNQHVHKWLNSYKVPTEYAETMLKITGVLDTIPYRLKFIHSTTPSAERYADCDEYEKHKEKYSTSLDAFMHISDE